MKAWPLILILLCGCAVPPAPVTDPSDVVNPLKLNRPLGGAAPKDVFYMGNSQILPTPDPNVFFEGDLPADTSNLSLWTIWTANSPGGPFLLSGILTTNHFEIPQTNTQEFFLFYGLND